MIEHMEKVGSAQFEKEKEYLVWKEVESGEVAGRKEKEARSGSCEIDLYDTSDGPCWKYK